MLRSATRDADQDVQDAMEDTMKEWQQRRRGNLNVDPANTTGNEAPVNLPLGPGEWDEPLGLPICVVCHGVGLEPSPLLQTESELMR